MKRKPDDEGNTDQAKRINMNFSVPPPNLQLPVQMPQQAMQPLPMTMLPPSPQPDAGYYLNNMNMNNLNGPWRGRNNRSGQNFGYNIRGGQNVWTRSSRGSGPNQRNYRPGGGQGPYFRGGGQKGNNQFSQQSFFQNQGFSCPNNFNNGPYSNFLAQGSWQAEGFVAQEDGSNAGSKSRAQGRPLTPSSTGSDMELTDGSGGGNTKIKRRSMSQSYPSRPWDREAAEKALATELEFLKALRNQNLVIKFPDPDLNKEIVKAFHPNIVNVHFQVPSGPRFCFVQLEEGADADEVMEALNSCTFGSGKLQVEKRGTKEDDNLCPETIDPLTLYIGNLPSTITIQTMREKFSTSSRIDIGYAQRMKYTRYAFIRYATAEDALDAFRKTHNLQLENRSVIVRFRRHKSAASPSQNSNKKLKTLDLEPESSFYADDSNVWLNSDTNDNLLQRVTTALPALEGWFNLDGLEGEVVCTKQKKKSAASAVSTSSAVSPVSSATGANSEVMSNSVKTKKEGDSDDEDEEEEEKLDDEEADEDEDDEDDSDDDSDEDEEDEEEDEEDEEEENTAPPPGASRDEDDDDSSDEDPQEYEDDDDDD